MKCQRNTGAVLSLFDTECLAAEFIEMDDETVVAGSEGRRK